MIVGLGIIVLLVIAIILFFALSGGDPAAVPVDGSVNGAGGVDG
jgi:hypothetical protein